jgi:hypothetical protein
MRRRKILHPSSGLALDEQLSWAIFIIQKGDRVLFNQRGRVDLASLVAGTKYA